MPAPAAEISTRTSKKPSVKAAGAKVKNLSKLRVSSKLDPEPSKAPAAAPAETKPATPPAKVDADMSLSVIPNIVLQLRLDDGQRDSDRLIPFEVIGPRSVLAFMQEEMQLESIRGLMSPFFGITLDEKSRVAAGIPRDATHFAFCYPVSGLVVEELLDAARTRQWLFHLLIGGFVYFDQYGDIIQTNALGLNPSAAALHLVGPFKAAAAAIAYLDESSRMQTIVLKDLADAGFRKFCWIHPAEAPGGVPLSTQHAYNDGAFVYITTGGAIFYALSMNGRVEEVDGNLGDADRGMKSAMGNLHKVRAARRTIDGRHEPSFRACAPARRQPLAAAPSVARAPCLPPHAPADAQIPCPCPCR
eukprot:7382323-Prymnesium_polylepis.1